MLYYSLDSFTPKIDRWYAFLRELAKRKYRFRSYLQKITSEKYKYQSEIFGTKMIYICLGILGYIS